MSTNRKVKDAIKMAISLGFYKYIYNWITDEISEKPIFRPFETNGNPYKAKVFIVGSHPSPIINVFENEIKEYADVLVNRDEFELAFENELSLASTENKGARRFVKWLEEKHQILTILSFINALGANDLASLKKERKDSPRQFKRGQEIFKEVVTELRPQYILLHGAYALEQFRKQFEGYYIEFGPQNRSLLELEGEGVFGKIKHEDGTEIMLLACRSLSYFKEDRSILAPFIQNFLQVIKEDVK